MADSLIKEGDTVVFDINGEKQMFLRIRAKLKIKMGNAYVSVEPLIGAPYGTLFVVSADGNNLERTQHVPSTDWEEPAEVTKNNSKIVDGNSSHQTLTHTEIEDMKESGIAGQEIVDALLTNSATFVEKTEFAQEKYKKRKAKKYVLVGCARRATAGTICATYFGKQPARVGHLRPDTLALMLSMGNVGPGARVLVLESCGGIVTGAVAERLGGHGVVVSSYLGSKPPSKEAFGCFNFDTKTKESVHTVPLVRLLEARQQQREQAAGSAANGAAVAAPSSGQDETMAEAAAAPAAAEEAAAAEAVPQETDPAGAEEQGTANEAQQVPALGGLPARDPRCWPCAEAMPFTSCLIAASSLDSTELLKMVFPLLSPSASFVVTGTWMQPLAESMVAMRDGGYAVNLAVQEAWWRQHQVLPMRTHPLVNMNHGGGYILSGTAVTVGTDLPIAGLGAAAPPAAGEV